MALNQLQFGGGRQQIGQNIPDAYGQMQAAQKKMDTLQEKEAEQIMLDTLHGTAPRQSFISRMFNPNRPQDQFKQPQHMWQEIGSVPPGQAPQDIKFNPEIFTQFGKKFDMEGMRGNMLAQAPRFGGEGVRRHLTKMLHDKLPDAIMKQQRMDSLNMLEDMAKGAQNQWGMDKWEDKLSEQFEKSPEAKQWWSNYIASFEDDMESMPDMAKKIEAKMGRTTKGMTEPQVATHYAKENIEKFVGSLRNMDKGDNTARAMKQLDEVIKKTAPKGYKFQQQGDSSYILTAPGKRDIVLSYDPNTMKWVGDYWGEHYLNRFDRYLGIADPSDPTQMSGYGSAIF